MERSDLIKRLSEGEFEHCQSRGLSPIKSKQLATEKMKEWKSLTDEQLQGLLDEEEFVY